MCFGFAGLLGFLTLAKFIVSAKCHVRLPQTGLTAAFFCKDMIVCACVCVLHTHHGMNGPANPIPALVFLLYLIFTAFLIPSLPLSSFSRVLLGEQS